MKFICLLISLCFCVGAYASRETVVIFGVTGDLAQRKLFPALAAGDFPDDTLVIGVGRRDWTNEAFDALPFETVYLRGDFESPATYTELKELLDPIPGEPLYYLAVGSSQFVPIVQGLSENALLDGSRVIFEKPFGRDLQSATHLREQLSCHLHDEQVYLMDHYLGKQIAADIRDDDRRWNRDTVDHITITLSEEIGVGTRGAFWEQTGLLRDLVQNHAIQLLALLTADGPDKKAELIDQLCIDQILRGQYEGYRKEGRVAFDSNVETFVAARLYIQSARWRGVPIDIIAGKSLSKKETSVRLAFRSGDIVTFNERGEIDAYRQLLRADKTHFATFDEVIASWRLLTPVLECWEQNPPSNFPNYKPGSDGPKGASDEKTMFSNASRGIACCCGHY